MSQSCVELNGLTSISNFNIPGCTDKKRIGEVVCGYKRYPDSDYVSVYLYVKKGTKYDDETILNRVEKSLAKDYSAKLLDQKKCSNQTLG